MHIINYKNNRYGSLKTYNFPQRQKNRYKIFFTVGVYNKIVIIRRININCMTAMTILYKKKYIRQEEENFKPYIIRVVEKL